MSGRVFFFLFLLFWKRGAYLHLRVQLEPSSEISLACCVCEHQDDIQGNNGNDVIFGKGGKDLIAGGKGKDTIYGGKGADTIDGNEGADVVYGCGDQFVPAGKDIKVGCN